VPAEVIVGSEAQALTVSNLIDQRPMSAFQVWTVLLCGFVLVLDGFDAQVIGFLTPSIARSTGIPVRTFGPILSASLAGLMVAAMATGPIADRWGRKWPVIISAFSFGIFSLLTARAITFNELLILRFLTGLGLGAAMPNVVALASEYIPRRKLSLFVTLLFIGMPLGSVICGLVSSAMLPTWGWQSVFYVGGIVPLAISVGLIAVLPESVQFLAVRGKDSQRMRKILTRISPELANAQIDFASVSSERTRKGMPVKYLFTDGRAMGTVLLWLPNFMNLLLLYFLRSWLPALLTEAGLSISAGVTATTFLSFGGIVGCLAEGPMMNASGAYVTLLSEFGLSGLFVGALALITRSLPLVSVVAFTLGFLITGAQAGLNALAASFYPTSIRSTGVGWALGVGRIGSIVGPLVAGMLLSNGWKPKDILLAGAVAGIFGWLVILLGNQIKGHVSPYAAELSVERSDRKEEVRV
jgi:AAHS family 4-hydroxybenzoate transporter-like MFS transporter